MLQNTYLPCQKTLIIIFKKEVRNLSFKENKKAIRTNNQQLMKQ